MRKHALFLSLTLAACSGNSDDDRPPADAGPTDTGDTSVCETWFVRYDLMPAQFDIRNTPFGRGDATSNVGPGSLRLRFDDNGGALAQGPVRLTEYHLELDFEVADVHTDIVEEVAPDECGAATGTFDGAKIAWSTPVHNYHASGTITCNAGEFICGVANLPNGTPQPRDTTRDQELMPFIYTSSTSTVIPMNGFIMDWTVIPNDDPGDTFLRFTGRETDRVCVREPDC